MWMDRYRRAVSAVPVGDARSRSQGLRVASGFDRSGVTDPVARRSHCESVTGCRYLVSVLRIFSISSSALRHERVELGDLLRVLPLLVLAEAEQVRLVLRPPAVEEQLVLGDHGLAERFSRLSARSDQSTARNSSSIRGCAGRNGVYSSSPSVRCMPLSCDRRLAGVVRRCSNPGNRSAK